MASPYILLKTAVFTILVPTTVAGLIPRSLARYDRESPSLDFRGSGLIGCVLLALGTLLYISTAWRFSDEGRGTPSPTDEPKTLVTGGIYGHMRNPMYVGVLLVIGGQALRYKSLHVLWWTAVCWLGFHRRIIEYEEPHLVEKHGEVYEEYRDRVPRWRPRLRSPDDV